MNNKFYINPLLLIDAYKSCHAELLPKGITKSVSYYTPRMSRVKMWDTCVFFGLRAFIQTWLIDYFPKHFFNRPEKEIMDEYKRQLDANIGAGNYDLEKIRKLHQLGYLPIEIVALPEGSLVPMKVPMFGITNTHPDFAWLPQMLESLISAEMWHPMLAATVGHTYRQIVNKYYALTCSQNAVRSRALSAFDFRGQECVQSAIKSAAGWCTSFDLSATVAVGAWLEHNYDCDVEQESVSKGALSTEHAVMCSNFAVDGDEETLLRRLLTEKFPNSSFSCVLDSYDYWNVIDNIIPKLKEEILVHNGCMLMRGDSGDCVDVVTKTVFKLWDIFGGTVNCKGYKELDQHVKAIYGDSITVQRCERIYQILEENGFAASNVALGVGSFSFQCIEEDGILKPFTRDTFSSCIKATYIEIDGKPMPIFKAPKEGNWKKSQKGCCVVRADDYGVLYCADEYTWKEAEKIVSNLLTPVYRDGKLVRFDDDLGTIRKRLNNNVF